MSTKIIQFDQFFEHTGEPRIQLLEHKRGVFEKHASAEVQDYLATVKPKEGKRYVLVLAMGASEYYGPNRNGDGFAERPVQVGGSWAVAEGETLVDHYKTFETHAHVYRHHINKDPAKSLGKVVKAFYNWNMHRVELLLEIDAVAGADIVQKIDAGEFPGVSMGCRIRYDVCSECGNRAATREQYCEHVSGANPEYGMNQLSPDGVRYFVWNPSPTLFDISFVFKPADKIGYMMKKVAHDGSDFRSGIELGEEVEAFRAKRATLQKISAIDKILHGEFVNPADVGLAPGEYEAIHSLVDNVVPGVMADSPELTGEVLEKLSRLSLPSAMSTLFESGIVPSSRETYYLMSTKLGFAPRRDFAERIAAVQGIIAGALVDTPHALDSLLESGMFKISADLVDWPTVEYLRPWAEKRALWEDAMARRYLPESYGGSVGTLTGAFDPNTYRNPTLQTLSWEDANTGRVYQTNRSTAEQASINNMKKQVAEGVGVAALGGVAVKALTAGKTNPWRHLALPAKAGALYGAYRVASGRGVPDVMTREGVLVPANTEFVERRGSVKHTPVQGSALMTFILAQDSLPSKQQYGVSKLASVDAVHRFRTQFSRSLAGLNKVASTSPVELPDLQVGSLAFQIGNFILGF